MFERFGQNSIKVIMYSQEESRRMGFNRVGTEQILLGIFAAAGDGRKALEQQGVKLKEARQALDKMSGKGKDKIGVEIPFTARAKKILEISWQYARASNSKTIETEHLLLAILAMHDCGGSKLLAQLNVSADALRRELKAPTLSVALDLATGGNVEDQVRAWDRETHTLIATRIQAGYLLVERLERENKESTSQIRLQIKHRLKTLEEARSKLESANESCS